MGPLCLHGHLGDKDQPFLASLSFTVESLTLLDLIQARLPGAELAFLSGIHSAAGDGITPDETIHWRQLFSFVVFAVWWGHCGHV